MSKMARRRVESHNGRWLTRPCWAACNKFADCCLGKNYSARAAAAPTADNERRNEDDEELLDESSSPPQYTLESRRVTQKSILPCLSFRQKFCYCCSRTTMTSDEFHPDGKGSYLFFLDVNYLISTYLSWSFRTSYFLLFASFSIFYFGLILVFSAVYFGISAYYPECVNSGGQMIGDGEGARMFGDCFHLSWTTFSTVGYGVIFPATGASDFFVPTGCVAVGVIGSFEAFMGVLYAGSCGAILFGKVLRSQNNAQVFFSDPIVVRFGKKELSDSSYSNGTMEHTDETKEHIGEMKEGHDEELGEEGSSSLMMADSDDKGIPCPSLEFRLVNRLHDVPSGEIVEANLACVAILDPKLSQLNKILPDSDGTHNTHSQLKVDEKTTIAELAKVLRDTDSKTANRSLAFHSADSKQPHMFTKISLDANEHPYFRRVWFGRHRLDENSPLLTPAVRNRVKLAGGYWPADMNNYQSIKKSIHFRHILVCISGTSNANATSVYAQKVYDLVDVNVGYRFVPMNYHTDDGLLTTDPYLLNAVYRQRGGGAEPF